MLLVVSSLVLVDFVAVLLVRGRRFQREQTREAKVMDEISEQQKDDLASGVE